MAQLRKYEIDALVSEIYQILKDKLPKFDDTKIKNSNDFKKLLKLEEEKNILENEIKIINKDIEKNVRKQLNSDNKYLHTFSSEEVLQKLKSDFNRENPLDTNLITRTVILNSNSDLNTIVDIVVKKLSKK